MAAAPAGGLVGAQGLGEQALRAVEPVGVGVRAAQHQRGVRRPTRCRSSRGPGARRPLTRARSQSSTTSSAFSPRVIASKPRRIEQGPLGVVPAGAGGRRARRGCGSGPGSPPRRRGCPPTCSARPGAACGRTRVEPGGLGVDRADGLFQLVVVEQGLGEPEDGVDTRASPPSPGWVERRAQVADGDGGRGQEGGAAQFVEDAGVHVGQRRFLEGALQTAAGGVRGADGEVFAGRLAQLLDEFGVVVRVDLEQVPGGGRGAAARVGDGPGGLAVHGGARWPPGWSGRRRWRSAGARTPARRRAVCRIAASA